MAGPTWMTWVESWPVYRQLTGTDRRGLGAAAKSSHHRAARTATADSVVKSVCPYCAVGPSTALPQPACRSAGVLGIFAVSGPDRRFRGEADGGGEGRRNSERTSDRKNGG